MDVTALQRLISEDITSGRTPLIVIADVGTPITGHVDNILRIQSLCKTHDIWLHLRGHSLAALALQVHPINGHVSFSFLQMISFSLVIIENLGLVK